MSLLAATDVGCGWKSGGGIGAALRTRFDTVIFLYTLSALTILQGIVSLIEGIRSARYMRCYGTNHPGASPEASPYRARASRAAPRWLPGRVGVFCPCKGVDHEFEKNIRSILGQDFPAFAVYFILESAEDPAYSVLRNIGAPNVLIAGEATDCGQKVHNLRYAVQSVGCNVDTYVFCDSDARYPRNWLAKITEPLHDGLTGVCTGYRWYTVRRFHIPTLLRSAWNSTALGVLGDHDRNFAWGGSIAIRRETFERIAVLDAWSGALSDDYAITRATQKAGLHVRFVPACLIPSYGECSFSELLEFTTRQIIITRVYHPRLWAIGFVAQTVFSLAFWGLLVANLWTGTPVLFLLWITIFTLSATRSAVRLSAVKATIPEPSSLRFVWFYVLSSPVVALLYQFNMTCAALTTDIKWRQIHYKLISPNQTLVRRSSAKAG